MRTRNCGWCTEQYSERDSDAHERERYCSRDCELKDSGEGDRGYLRQSGRPGYSVSKKR